MEGEKEAEEEEGVGQARDAFFSPEYL